MELERGSLQRRFCGTTAAGAPQLVWDEPARTYSLTWHVADPGLKPLQLGAAKLRATLPSDYPASAATVTFEDIAGLPLPIIAALNRVLAAQVRHLATSRRAHVFGAIKWVDAHLSSVIDEIVKLQAEAATRSGASSGGAAAAAVGEAESVAAAAGAAAGAGGGGATAAAAAGAKPRAAGTSGSSEKPTHVVAAGASSAGAAVTTAAPAPQAPTPAPAAASVAAPAPAATAAATPAPAPPAAPPSTLQGLFSAASLRWTQREHCAFEQALQELMVAGARSPLQRSLWVDVAERVNKANAAAAAVLAARRVVFAPSPVRSAEQCLARYLTLRQVTKEWTESSVVQLPAPSAGSSGGGGRGRAVGFAASECADGAAAGAGGGSGDAAGRHRHGRRRASGSASRSRSRSRAPSAGPAGAAEPRQGEVDYSTWRYQKPASGKSAPASGAAPAEDEEDTEKDFEGEGSTDDDEYYDDDDDEEEEEQHEGQGMRVLTTDDEDAAAAGQAYERGIAYERGASGSRFLKPSYDAKGKAGARAAAAAAGGAAAAAGELEDENDGDNAAGGSGGRSRSAGGSGKQLQREVFVFDYSSSAGGAGAEDEDEEAEEEEDFSGLGGAFEGVELSPQHKGCELMLRPLSLFGVGAAVAGRVRVVVQCDRCQHVTSANLAGARVAGAAEAAEGLLQPLPPNPGGIGTEGVGAEESTPRPVVAASAEPAAAAAASASETRPEWKEWCKKCSLLLSLSFRPALVHEGSGTLGYVDTTHCVVTGLTDLTLLASCFECGSVAEWPRYTPPATVEAACRRCYCRLRISTPPPGWAVQVATRENAAARAYDPAAAKARRDARLQQGRPLPGNGACKHYERSFRWLRFPCCNIAYACNECHDVASDHVAEWAQRQICGFCSREQPYANGPCVSCGKQLGRKEGSTRFWEGGAGQRNKAFLDRRDPRKYKNSAAKTKSKKSQRVGAAGKKATARKVAAAAGSAGGGAGGGGGGAGGAGAGR